MGGTNDPENLVTLCVSCNASKSATHPAVWYANSRAVYRKLRAQLKKPIDRARGRVLCERYCPGWLERKRQKGRRYRFRKQQERFMLRYEQTREYIPF